MHLRPIRLALHIVAVTALAGSGVLLTGAPSHADSSAAAGSRPDSYGGDSTASAMHFVADRNPQPTPVTDLFHAESPYAITALDSSGSASASASPVYPGAGLLGVPALLCQVKACLPLPPYVLGASASYPTQPEDKAQVSTGVINAGPLTAAPDAATAHADPSHVESSSETGSSGFTPVLGSDSARSHSKQVFEGSTLVVTAESEVRGLTIGAGALHIDSVRSVASARVDGGSVTSSSAVTTITGATAGGAPVSIDSTGIHVTSQGDGGAAQNGANTALQQLGAAGITVRLLTPDKSAKPGAASAAAGGVLVTFAHTVTLPTVPNPLPPAVPAGPPGYNGDYMGTVTVAGAGVTAFATPSQPLTLPPVTLPGGTVQAPSVGTVSLPGTSGSTPLQVGPGPVSVAPGSAPAVAATAPHTRPAAVLGVDLSHERLAVLVLVLLGYPLLILLAAPFKAPSRLPRAV